MKGDLQTYFGFTYLAIIILLIVGNIFGQANNSDQTIEQKERKNYLQDVKKYLPPGVKKDFFSALEKSESEFPDLVDVLKFMRYEVYQQITITGAPDEKSETSILNSENAWFYSDHANIFWETTAITENDKFRLLFFQTETSTKSRPGEFCLIVITDTNFKIRVWKPLGCQENFVRAKLEKVEDDFVFKITAKPFGKGLQFSRFKISPTEITYITETTE